MPTSDDRKLGAMSGDELMYAWKHGDGEIESEIRQREDCSREGKAGQTAVLTPAQVEEAKPLKFILTEGEGFYRDMVEKAIGRRDAEWRRRLLGSTDPASE